MPDTGLGKAAPKPRDYSLRVRGARIAVREWGEVNQPAVLALHGWLDNAASFDALAPLLSGYRIIAIDLPGHGYTEHRSACGTYNIWDDLPDIELLAEALGVKQYHLLGHSRGAIISTLIAATAKDRVLSLVMLDGAHAPPAEDQECADQLARFCRDYTGETGKRARVYESISDAVDARVRATGIHRDAAEPIVARNLYAVEGGYRWRTDARLQNASALKLSLAQWRAAISTVEVPGFMVAAESGNADLIGKMGLLQDYKSLQRLNIEGCHHCHMLSQAEEIADAILNFWQQT